MHSTIDLKAEYSRLRSQADDPAFHKTLNDACFRGLGYMQDECGHWCQTMAKPDDVLGVSIDSKTLQCFVTKPGEDHCAATLRLMLKLGITSEQDPRIIRGHILEVEGWRFPFVILPFHTERVVVEKIDAMLMTKGVGLPITTILFNYSFM